MRASSSVVVRDGDGQSERRGRLGEEVALSAERRHRGANRYSPGAAVVTDDRCLERLRNGDDRVDLSL
jgi:hypothetical protein